MEHLCQPDSEVPGMQLSLWYPLGPPLSDKRLQPHPQRLPLLWVHDGRWGGV
jgi:hypothetical protein